MALAWTVMACASCSVLVDQNRVQCANDTECHERGPQFAGAVCVESICQPDPQWGCLGSVTLPRTEVGPFTVTILMRDLITGRPIPGVTGRLCEKLDTTCKDPIGPDVPADSNGDLTLQVKGGFDGYAELRAPDKMPGLYFFYPPVNTNREIPFVPLLEPALVEELARLNMKALRPDRGHILLGAYDCRRMPSSGIKLSTPDTDDETTPFYVLNDVPNAGAPSTDNSGRGGFMNLKQGIVALTATLAADARRIAAVSLFVRPGMMTYTTIVPSP